MKATIPSSHVKTTCRSSFDSAEMKGWHRPHGNCLPHIHYFPASPGYLEKAEKMKTFHLYKQFFTPLSLTNVQLFWSIIVF